MTPIQVLNLFCKYRHCPDISCKDCIFAVYFIISKNTNRYVCAIMNTPQFDPQDTCANFDLAMRDYLASFIESIPVELLIEDLL